MNLTPFSFPVLVSREDSDHIAFQTEMFSDPFIRTLLFEMFSDPFSALSEETGPLQSDPFLPGTEHAALSVAFGQARLSKLYLTPFLKVGSNPGFNPGFISEKIRL